MIKSTSVFAALAACTALLFTVPSAHADQTGDSVSCAQVGGGNFICTPATSVVGPGTTFTVGPSAVDPYINVDLFAGGMTLSFVQDANLMNTILDFSDSTTPWMSYALLSQSGMTGFSASNLSLNGGVLEVNLRGTSNLAGNGFTLSFDQTPEPASIVLLGTGMLAMLETVRRRQRA